MNPANTFRDSSVYGLMVDYHATYAGCGLSPRGFSSPARYMEENPALYVPECHEEVELLKVVLPRYPHRQREVVPQYNVGTQGALG
ncbi:hypothetical protein J6590_008496 [Homalodisca vitripennis]|nr:hypothetical protein J6590_008496 [Homalodisca vitripennis]